MISKSRNIRHFATQYKYMCPNLHHHAKYALYIISCDAFLLKDYKIVVNVQFTNTYSRQIHGREGSIEFLSPRLLYSGSLASNK